MLHQNLLLFYRYMAGTCQVQNDESLFLIITQLKQLLINISIYNGVQAGYILSKYKF